MPHSQPKDRSSRSDTKFTVLGGRGFIGGATAALLRERGYECEIPERGDESIFTKPLGNVIYAIGLTADFRTRPFDTVEAHVCLLRRLLKESNFTSLVYLSSTRIYGNSSRTDEEAPIQVDVTRPDSVYDVSKLMGESLCLHCGRVGVRIARLSNVVGIRADTDIFVDQVLREGFSRGEVELRTTLDSSKDYIHISDVVQLLVRVSLKGEHPIYNIASGIGVSNKEIIELLSACTGIRATVAQNAEKRAMAPIDVRRVVNEYGFVPTVFAEYFPVHIEEFRRRHVSRS